MKAKNTVTETLTEIPEVAFNFDSAGFQKALIAEVKKAGGTENFYKQAGGASSLARSIMKPFYQAMLDVEMAEHLGYEKHGTDGKSGGNARNGKGAKKIRGDFGEIAIETPRDRDASFDPKIIKKRESSVGDFTEKIISLYSRGMTTREIEQHLQEIYGIDVSAQFVSRATERVSEEITEWQNRDLDRVYPVVYVDGLRVSIRDATKGVLSKCVYIVLGISVAGKQEVLGLWIEETEGARFWLKVFNDLKARKVEDILILCGDGLKGLPEAVQAVYPQTDIQLCVVHQIRTATKFVAFKNRKQFCQDMKPIYTAPTVEAAEVALNNFAEIWESRYPMSVASWRRNWVLLTAFFKYPVELRKMIYTTNAIESLNAQLRKNTANRKVFPTDDSVIKILFLNVRNFTNRWSKRHGWDIVMNQLSIIFPDRLNISKEFEI